MGISNYFRALPIDDELVRLARIDKDIAEDALFPILLFDVPSLHIMLRPPGGGPCLDLERRYPQLREWHLREHKWDPLDFAKVICSASGIDLKPGQPGFEESLALRFVRGDRIFSEQFKSTTGHPIHVSSPEVVREFCDFANSFDPGLLPDGFGQSFVEIAGFYQRIAADDRLAVFVMRT